MRRCICLALLGVVLAGSAAEAGLPLALRRFEKRFTEDYYVEGDAIRKGTTSTTTTSTTTTSTTSTSSTTTTSTTSTTTTTA